ncbi:tetratricopeptide repeat protein, partial [Planctomycetota bacterium]
AVFSMGCLARFYTSLNRYKDVEKLLNELVPLSKRVLGEQDPNTVEYMGLLANLYGHTDRYDQAIELYREVIKISEDAFFKERPYILVYMYNLACLLMNQGQYDKAEPLYREMVERSGRVLPKEHRHLRIYMEGLAWLYIEQGRYEEADRLYVQVWDAMRKGKDLDHPETQKYAEQVIHVYEAQNKPEKAEEWRSKLIKIEAVTAYNPDPSDGAESVDPDNVTFTWTPGLGAKFHTVYLGNDYDEVDNATVGVSAGTATYNPGPLELEKIYYWRVDEFDGLATYKGDVWGFTTPGAAATLQPANGAVTHNQILNWTPAMNAISHHLYFGTDSEAVKNATTASPEYKGKKARGAENYDPGQLDWGTSYYWRVDAVYGANTVKGLVWGFTTADFLVVEDFESYTDDVAAGQAIWQTWVDGTGIADNGAQVGYLQPPHAEQTVVYSGAQSMRLLYANVAGVGNSEVSLALTALHDWTTQGVGELSLWFMGSSANAAEPLYVAISNPAGAPAIVANGEANAAKRGVWTEWVVPLQAFSAQGIDLTNVSKIAIGLGDKGCSAPGGTGTMFIDDIRLYRAPP